MRILGIETSCDETAVCLIEAEADFGSDFHFRTLGNALYSQVELHRQYGGVFPNIAKREHAKNLVLLLTETLRQADALRPIVSSHKGQTFMEMLKREPELRDQISIFLEQYDKPAIDCIAVTHGPGLEPALWVGVNFAKALSAAWNVPIVAVNHMKGHIVLSMMQSDRLAPFEFPLLALLISGGHTELVLSRTWQQYELIGQTRDDAAGEAFDKVARLLNLPYPGGPEISRIAEVARKENALQNISLPRPMLHEKNFDFSFSGLKTAVRKIVEAHQPLSDEMKKEIAREFEDTVADVLVAKTVKAIEEYGIQTVVVGGGVSANKHIRSELAKKLERESCTLLVPPPELATDNALMIALAGYFHAINGEFSEADSISANGNLKLTSSSG